MPLTALTNLSNQLLPAGTILLTGKIHQLQKPLFQDEEILVKTASGFRMREFTAGRTIAREAIQRLGFEESSIQKGNGGEPKWPCSVVGSISHKGGFCGVIVAKGCEYRSLGLDIEFMEYLNEAVWDTFSSESELRNLGISTISIALLANILFCIKESFFKALYPILGNDTPPIDKILPILKIQDNHIVTSLVYAEESVVGGAVYDNRLIISWAIIKN